MTLASHNRFLLPQGQKPQKMFFKLNEAFRSFALDLPPLLQDLSQKLETFTGGSNGNILEGFSDVNPLYSLTPFLFWESFSEIAERDFLDIATAGAFLSFASILTDHLSDNEVADVPAINQLENSIYRFSERNFIRQFPSESEFWEHYWRLWSIHEQGLSLEIDFQSKKREMPWEVFNSITKAKMAPIIVTAAGFCAFINNWEIFEGIEESLNLISLGGQLFDDILDWEPDNMNNHRTFFLSHLHEEVGKSEKLANSKNDQKIMGEIILRELRFLKTVKAQFEQALTVKKLPFYEGWHHFVNYYLSEIDDKTMTATRSLLALRLTQLSKIDRAN